MQFSRACTLLGVGLVLIVALVGCSGAGANGDEDDQGGDEDPTEDTTPPGAPTGLDAVSDDGAVVLDWEAVDAEDLDGYNVYRATTSFDEVSDREPIGDSPVSSAKYTDGAVGNGTEYHYRVTAVDQDENESNPSSEATATPFSDPPGRP